MPETLVVDRSEAVHTQALHLLHEEESGKVSLIAPDLLLTEFASLIAKRARRKQMLATEDRDAYRLLEGVATVLFDTRPLLDAALQLALTSHASLWDCVYLALAIEQRCSLVTADRRFFRSSGSRHPAIRLLE